MRKWTTCWLQTNKKIPPVVDQSHSLKVNSVSLPEIKLFSPFLIPAMKRICHFSVFQWKVKVNKLTTSRAVRDSIHLPSKLLLTYFLDKFSSVGNKALDVAILPVSHTQLLSVREEDEAVWDSEWLPVPSVWWALSQRIKEKSMNKCGFCIVPQSTSSDGIKSWKRISLCKWDFSSLAPELISCLHLFCGGDSNLSKPNL